uniref:Uncharacterized protein n=1 Tax=Opuntia streptacantha TaxID=393608 RepID=A0A7C9DAL0_OPUST
MTTKLLGRFSSLLFSSTYASGFPDMHFSISFRNKIKGPFLHSSFATSKTSLTASLSVSSPAEFSKHNRSAAQKKPRSFSQWPPRLLPSGIDSSNLTPIFDASFPGKTRTTFPL